VPLSFLSAVVEGPGDEAIARRLAEETGFSLSQVYVKRGKEGLDAKLQAYAAAARFSPWLVLRDLDHDADCAPTLANDLLPIRPPTLLLRIPVRSAESWLLADRESIASYLSVPVGTVPGNPESLENPKRSLVDLARRSRRRAIRDDMVPAPGTSPPVGRGYTGRLIEFTSQRWLPQRAALRSDSLARCLDSLRELLHKHEVGGLPPGH